jgi:ribose transport system permease protein
MTASVAALPSRHAERRLVSRYALLFMVVALYAAFALSQPVFGTFSNFVNIWRTAGIAAVMYIGLTWVIALGEMEVSFMEVAAFSGMVFAALLLHHRGAIACAAVAALAGFAFGLLNGVLVGYLRFPSLIVTIATGGLARSLGITLGGGQPIYINDGGAVTVFANATVAGLPVLGLVVVVLYALSWWAQERFVFGHHVYAMAQNRAGLEQVGVRCPTIVFSLFILSGATAAIAGVLLAATLNSGQPTIGGSFFLDGLTAVFLGASVIRLGQPNIIGTAVGVIILAILVNGLALMGWPAYAREIVKGSLLLIGVAVAVAARRRRT